MIIMLLIIITLLLIAHVLMTAIALTTLEMISKRIERWLCDIKDLLK